MKSKYQEEVLNILEILELESEESEDSKNFWEDQQQRRLRGEETLFPVVASSEELLLLSPMEYSMAIDKKCFRLGMINKEDFEKREELYRVRQEMEKEDESTLTLPNLNTELK